jgi:hypothetical protein
MIVGLSVALACAAVVAKAQPAAAPPAEEPYQQAMAKAEEAKGKGDMPAMAIAIRHALKFGPGNEYAWRSLAWALNLSGQWQDSLAVARENIARFGATGWPLEQLAESQMGAGDWAAAKATLAQIDALPPDAIGNAKGAIDGTRRRLLDLTGQRRYELHWKVDMGQAGPGHDPERLLMPRWGDPRQTFDFTVTGADSYKRVTVGHRDFIDVVQKPGQPFTIDATVTIRGFALGGGPLSRVNSFAVPPELKIMLGPFHHGDVFDPASPLCARIAAFSRSTTMVRTVQNLLNWMRDNMHYGDTKNATLDTILAGGVGVCHHYCSTFAALCRAAGVPSRVSHGVVLSGEGEFKDNAGSHGWDSVYIDGLGWVPVDPLDSNSLALFGRSNYLLTDYANETPEDNHFDYHSIQGYKCDGKVVAIEAQN